MALKHELRKTLWRLGYDISRFSPKSHVLARRKQLLHSYAIDVLVDVGADTGQYAQQMRDIGYRGRIVSFEPRSSAYELLQQKANADPAWRAIKCAVGSCVADKEINLAANSASSSIRGMLPSHIESAPESKYVGRELISIKPLDSMMGALCSPKDNIYLKIDTQGYESEVIKGAESSLHRINTVQLEMSLIPLYQDEMLFGEMHNLLTSKGYTLVSIEPGFSDEHSGQLLQADGIYHRF